jgi:hypothetical protein
MSLVRGGEGVGGTVLHMLQIPVGILCLSALIQFFKSGRDKKFRFLALGLSTNYTDGNFYEGS